MGLLAKIKARKKGSRVLKAKVENMKSATKFNDVLKESRRRAGADRGNVKNRVAELLADRTKRVEMPDKKQGKGIFARIKKPTQYMG